MTVTMRNNIFKTSRSEFPRERSSEIASPYETQDARAESSISH